MLGDEMHLIESYIFILIKLLVVCLILYIEFVFKNDRFFIVVDFSF